MAESLQIQGSINIPTGEGYKINNISQYTNAEIDSAINTALSGQATFSALYAYNNFI